MKFIRVYIEIGNDKSPIYANEFQEYAKNRDNILIASKEYLYLLGGEQLDNVWLIPDEMMEKFDKNLETASSRYIMMKINNNDELKEWFKRKFSSTKEVNGLYMRGEYSSFIMAAREVDMSVFIQNEVKPLYEEEDKERNYQLIVDSLERRIQYLDTVLKQRDEAIESLRTSIDSNNHYIENLQVHATNLDNELKKYKEFYNANHDIVDNMEYQINHAEQEASRYIDLYRKQLNELDELKTEKLELEQKLQKR